ncbi:hypothetical protein TNCV_923631 [Trichonephila clavipes]|nr:hypothetical protein TNCV_923631 [Trichonephila clavipes]
MIQRTKRIRRLVIHLHRLGLSAEICREGNMTVFGIVILTTYLKQEQTIISACFCSLNGKLCNIPIKKQYGFDNTYYVIQGVEQRILTQSVEFCNDGLRKVKKRSEKQL